MVKSNKTKLNFNEFCTTYCDGLFNPKLKSEEQCKGYKLLKSMADNYIKPATLKEMLRWEREPNISELLSKSDIKYLRFLHPLLRPQVIKNWNKLY